MAFHLPRNPLALVGHLCPSIRNRAAHRRRRPRTSTTCFLLPMTPPGRRVHRRAPIAQAEPPRASPYRPSLRRLWTTSFSFRRAPSQRARQRLAVGPGAARRRPFVRKESRDPCRGPNRERPTSERPPSFRRSCEPYAPGHGAREKGRRRSQSPRGRLAKRASRGDSKAKARAGGPRDGDRADGRRGRSSGCGSEATVSRGAGRVQGQGRRRTPRSDGEFRTRAPSAGRPDAHPSVVGRGRLRAIQHRGRACLSPRAAPRTAKRGACRGAASSCPKRRADRAHSGARTTMVARRPAWHGRGLGGRCPCLPCCQPSIPARGLFGGRCRARRRSPECANGRVGAACCGSAAGPQRVRVGEPRDGPKGGAHGRFALALTPERDRAEPWPYRIGETGRAIRSEV